MRYCLRHYVMLSVITLTFLVMGGVCVSHVQAEAPASASAPLHPAMTLSSAESLAAAGLACIGCIPEENDLRHADPTPLHMGRLSDNCGECHEEGFVISTQLHPQADAARAQLMPIANELESALVTYGMVADSHDTRYQQALADFQSMQLVLHSDSPWAAQSMLVELRAVLAILEHEAESGFITAPGNAPSTPNLALVPGSGASTFTGLLQLVTNNHLPTPYLWWAQVVFVFVVALSVLFAVSRRGPPVPNALQFDFEIYDDCRLARNRLFFIVRPSASVFDKALGQAHVHSHSSLKRH